MVMKVRNSLKKLPGAQIVHEADIEDGRFDAACSTAAKPPDDTRTAL